MEGNLNEQQSTEPVPPEELLEELEMPEVDVKENRTLPVKLLTGLLLLAVFVAGYFLFFDGRFISEREEQIALTKPEVDDEASYEKFITKHAVVSEILTVGAGCTMDPLIIEITPETDLVIKNEDDVIRVVAFEDGNFFQVSPGRDRTINISEKFKRDNGIYRYRCTESQQTDNTGVMYIN